jgi:hypothetical protein
MGDEQYAQMQKASQLQAKEFDISKSIVKLEEIFNKF